MWLCTPCCALLKALLFPEISLECFVYVFPCWSQVVHGKAQQQPQLLQSTDKSTLYDHVYTEFGDQSPKQSKVEAVDVWHCMCSGSRGEGSQPAS